MSSLEAIPVKTEHVTGNVAPLLHEIRHALERLLETGEPTTLDLRGMPITATETEALEAALGTGEIEAKLDAFGRSAIRETATAGVWIVEHFNSDDALVAKHIEVTQMPEILRSQRSDIAAGLERLERRLGSGQPAPTAANGRGSMR